MARSPQRAHKRACHRAPHGSCVAATWSTSPLVLLDGGWPYPDAVVRLWRTGELVDLSVGTGPETSLHACHRVVLAAASPFLAALLTHPLCDRDHPRLPEVPTALFRVVLEWTYTGRCAVATELLPELLRVSDFLNMDALKTRVVASFLDALGDGGCDDAGYAHDLWCLGERTATDALVQAARDWLLAHFELLGTAVTRLPVSRVRSLLEDPDLMVTDEDRLVEAVRHVVDELSLEGGTALHMLRCVRLCDASTACLRRTLFAWEPLQTCAAQTMLRDLCLDRAQQPPPRYEDLLTSLAWEVTLPLQRPPLPPGRKVMSPVFETGRYRWRLRIFPGGLKSHLTHRVGIYLYLQRPFELALGCQLDVRFTLHLWRVHHHDAAPEHLHTSEYEGKFSRDCVDWGHRDFCSADDPSLYGDRTVLQVDVHSVRLRRLPPPVWAPEG